MTFRLNVDGSELEVPAGELIVGRGDECKLRLDDPLVSRFHARFINAGGKLLVEDLGSRNGITVNGVSVKARVELKSGDVVTVGSTRMTVIAPQATTLRAGPGRPRSAALAVTLAGGAPTGTSGRTALASRGELIEAAFREKNFAAVEYHLDSLANGLLLDGPAVRANPALLQEFTRHALRLVAATDSHTWLDRVFVLHKILSCQLSAADVDELHVVARKARYPYSNPLRAYLDWLRERIAELTPAERFALQRAEGLARVLGLKG